MNHTVAILALVRAADFGIRLQLTSIPYFKSLNVPAEPVTTVFVQA